MLDFRATLVMLRKPASLLAAILILPVAFSTAPARAQEFFGIFRIFAPPAPVAPSQPLQLDPGSTPERPKLKLRVRPITAPVEQAEIKKPVEPRKPGEMDNPVPALLADSTLQPGDMVMFPDGLRVFTGKPGSQHKLDDFKPLSKAGKALSREMRKLVAHLLPSENPAWSTDGVGTGSKLAANTKGVEATGSVKRASR
jgi:hypothetical protein